MVKKLIGLACWLLGFLIPFKYAILDTDEVILENGRADNILGLLSFVAMIALFFAGYAFYDSASPKPGSESHGH